MCKKSLFVLLSVALFISCTKAPKIDLKQTPFHLQIPATASEEFFNRVQTMALDRAGNFYFLDAEKMRVVKFDAAGVFVKDLILFGVGDGFVNRPCSIQVLDSTLVLHNIGSLQFFSLDGQFRKSILIAGRCAITVSADGVVLANRMGDSFQYNHCLETYDLDGKLLAQFRPPRNMLYKKNSIDFALAEFTREGTIAFIPTLLDSAFMYDPSGRLLYARKMEPVRSSKVTEFEFHVEDLFIEQNNIYLLRVQHDESTEQVLCKVIDQYDLKFNHLRSYVLPSAITIGIDADPWAPWYHKLAVRDQRFFLMLSKPIEHLAVYEPVTSSQTASK